MTPGQKAKQRMIQAAERELKDIADDLLDRAKRQVSTSPVVGDPDPAVSLRESGRVAPIVREGDTLSIEVGFHTEYAAAQHEGAWSYIRDEQRVVAVVKNHPGGGKTKFLSDPLKEMIPTYQERLAKAVRREMDA